MDRRSFLRIGALVAGDTGVAQLTGTDPTYLAIEDWQSKAMAESPYPLPRGLRQTEILNGDGGTTYGPFEFQIFDPEDIVGFVRLPGQADFNAHGLLATKMNGAPLDFFTVTFSVPVPVGAEFMIASLSYFERSVGVHKGNRIDSLALEKEFTKLAAAAQELRRDVGRSIKVGFGQRPQDLPVSDGVSVLGWDENGNLVNRPTDGALLARAEAAAEAALSAVPNAFPPNRLTMAAYPQTIGNAMLTEDGRFGQFMRVNSDVSTRVAADPAQIGTVPLTSDPSGSSGAYIWVKMPRFDPRRAGAIGDVNGDNTSPDDWQAIQLAMTWAAAERCILEIDRPYRIGQSNKGRSSPASMLGQLTLCSNLYVEGRADGMILPVGFSRSGSIITNLRASNDSRSIVNNVRMMNVVVDMRDYEPFVLRGDVASATSSTITLPAIDADGRVTSTVNGWYNDLIIQIVDGPGQTEYAFIKNYVGATRTANLLKVSGSRTWKVRPNRGSKFEIGFNDNAWGLSGGFSDGQFNDCEVYNVPIGILNSGGKGFNAENGAELVLVYGFYGENIGGALTFVQGHAGFNDNGSRRWVRKVTFRDFYGVDCGALVAALSQDGAGDPDGNPDDNLTRFLDGYGERCGHMDRRISAEKAKNAAIIIEEAGNVLINNMVIDNGDWTPVYTTDSYRVGYGLKGHPHLIQGWGRNVEITNIWGYGNFGSLYSLQRNRAFGGDAGPTGKPQHTYRNRIEHVRHQGELDGYPVLVHRNPLLRPDDDEVRMLLKDIRLNNDPTAVIDPDMAIYTGLLVEDVSDWFTSRTVTERLSVKRFVELGNTVESVRNGLASKIYRKTFRVARDVTSTSNGGEMAATAERTFTVTATGVALTGSNAVYVSMNGARVSGILLSAQVTADDVVTVYVNNTTNAVKVIGDRTYTLHVDTLVE